MSALTKFIDQKLGFASDAEATNFSAHAGWSLALPLAGLAIAGPVGAYVAGGAWLVWSLVNEMFLHGPTGSHERAQDLVSRLAPCSLVLAAVAMFR
jgi:hypothetical protein